MTIKILSVPLTQLYGDAPDFSLRKKSLQKKVADHNAKNPKYRATYGMLAAVFRRGVGAYRTNPASVRGNVTGATQWGLARVNAFIKGLKGKFPRNKKFIRKQFFTRKLTRTIHQNTVLAAFDVSHFDKGSC